MKLITRYLTCAAALLAVLSCEKVKTEVPEVSGAVEFISSMADGMVVKSVIEGYEPLPAGYELNIRMSSKKSDGTDERIDSALYNVPQTGKEVPSVLAAVNKTGNTPLYWPGNAIGYAFSATAGLDTIPTVQNTAALLRLADRLSGFAGTDESHDALSYKTAKEWKTANSSTTIPLYLKHDCAMISVILKAGEGVSESALLNANVGKTLTASIYSYGPEAGDTTVVAAPYHEAAQVNMTGRVAATTMFRAIVEAHDYYADEATIVRIVLNNQKYSFSSAYDDTTEDKDEIYKLEPGEHLELTVTLGRDGRIIHIYACQRDWDTVVNEDIVTDDFGHGTDPVIIHRGEGQAEGETSFVDFVNSENNAKGNIAILNNDIRLTNISESDMTALNGTLNLNGHVVRTTHALFSSIAATGILKNGYIAIEDGMPFAVGEINEGTIDKIRVIGSQDAPDATLSSAGLVFDNKGTIRGCTNSVKVCRDSKDGYDSKYVGGIAAIQSEGAKITGCTVNGKVCAPESDTEAVCGGIVGLTVESTEVSSSTYDYGVTMLQKGGAVRNNIIGEIPADAQTTISGNAWPTIDTDPYADANTFVNPFTGVIDYDDELTAICGLTDGRFRIADDITLPGTWNDSLEMQVEIDGNGKTIHTNGKPVFTTVSGTMSDLTVMLKKAIIGNSGNSSDGKAGLAITLSGGTLDNIFVTIPSEDKRGSIYIQSANVGGIVTASIGNSVISNCRTNVSLVVATAAVSGIVYAGGIVAEAENLTISGCQIKSGVTIKKQAAVNDGVTVYVGGIIGGLGWRRDEHDNGSLVTDNASFIKQNSMGGSVNGGIAGIVTETGAAAGCIGNWWQAASSTGTSDPGAASLGNKNAIVPTEL